MEFNSLLVNIPTVPTHQASHLAVRPGTRGIATLGDFLSYHRNRRQRSFHAANHVQQPFLQKFKLGCCNFRLDNVAVCQGIADIGHNLPCFRTTQNRVCDTGWGNVKLKPTGSRSGASTPLLESLSVQSTLPFGQGFLSTLELQGTVFVKLVEVQD